MILEESVLGCHRHQIIYAHRNACKTTLAGKLARQEPGEVLYVGASLTISRHFAMEHSNTRIAEPCAQISGRWFELILLDDLNCVAGRPLELLEAWLDHLVTRLRPDGRMIAIGSRTPDRGWMDVLPRSVRFTVHNFPATKKNFPKYDDIKEQIGEKNFRSQYECKP